MNVKSVLGLTPENCIGTTSSSPFLGSPDFDEVPFHVKVGFNPQIGTYVIIERDSNMMVHYGRITNGTEENPRADPSGLQKNQAYQVGQKDPRPGDQAPHVTRVMTVETLGEIHLDLAGKLEVKDKTILAQTGKGVYEAPPRFIAELLGTPSDPAAGFHLGSVESGNHSVDFVLPMEAAVRHTAFVGKTGVGKSYAVGVYIEEAAKHGISTFAIDVLGDMTNMAEDLGGRTYHAGKDFRIPYSIIGTSEFLKFVPNLTPQQTELVTLAYDHIYGAALDTLDAKGAVAVPLERLTQEILEVAEKFGQADVGSRAARRVEAAIKRSKILTTETEDWLNRLADTPLLNVFVGHLGQNSRNLVVGGASRLLQILRRKGQTPPHMFVLDEAHLFLPGGRDGDSSPSTGVIREMVRTARHDAIGLVLVTQSPASMDRQVLLTCNTRVVFALDREDLKLVSGTMGDISEEMINRIPKLAKGTAIVTSGMDIIRHPALVKIRKRNTREGAPTPNLAEEVKLWRKQKKF